MGAERYGMTQVVVATDQFAIQPLLLGTPHRFQHDGLEGADQTFDRGAGFSRGADRDAGAATDRLGGALAG